MLWLWQVQGGGGLEVEADIGNFKVLDPGLGRTHPHGWILTPACRSRGAPQSSFVSVSTRRCLPWPSSPAGRARRPLAR